MAAPRKTAHARKTATRKTARKNAGKTTARKASSARRKSSSNEAPSKRWSQRVTRESDALDLKHGMFTLRDPKRIAASLKRSAERSSRRKAGAYRSALSMLTFYINRAGKTLPKTQRDRLQRAKFELKHQFGKDPSSRRTPGPIPRVVAFGHWGSRLSITRTPVIMGPGSRPGRRS
jgi:hypothetical protein